MRIAQITDFHLDDFLAQKFSLNTAANFEDILADIAVRGVDQLVLTGDFGVPERYPWLVARLMRMDLPFDVILGNHDKAESKLPALVQSGLVDRARLRRDEYCYSQRLEKTRLLFLDTGRGETSAEQKQWLKAELSSVASDKVVVFAHHPILDCRVAMDRSMALRDRGEVAEILFQSGKTIDLFCGHYHFTHETTERNVHQFVTPACIMQIRGEGDLIVSDSFDFGYRLIDLSPPRMKTETRMFVSPRKVMPGE